MVEGRRARDERWQAGSWRGRNEIWREFEAEAGLRMEMEKVLMLRDVVVLEGGPAGPGQSSLRHEDMGVFGTIILAGPVFESLGKLFMDEFVALPRIGGRKWGDEDDCVKDEDDATREFRSWRTRRVEQEVRDNLLWSAANLRSSVVVKFTARELEGAKSWIESMWRWDRTIADEFGPGGFMCLR